jgi:hypothetical protein
MTAGKFTLRVDRVVSLLQSGSGKPAILLNASNDPKKKDDELNVNSDGSPRAYHLLDPRGEKFALNDMYSGSVRVFDDEVEIKPGDGATQEERTANTTHYYDVFARFVRENGDFGVAESTYDPRNDVAYKLGDDFGNNLDPPGPSLLSSLKDSVWSLATDFLFPPPGPADLTLKEIAAPVPLSGYNCLTCIQTKSCKVCFKNDIIKSSGGKLCIREDGRYRGFLVNQTGLDDDAGNAPDPENAEDKKCDVPVNLDAEKLPGFVLPGGQISPDGYPDLKAEKGDVVVGFNPKSGMWAFGVVSDAGPPGKLGEASIGFNRVLQRGYKKGAIFPRPVSYLGDLVKTFQPLRPVTLLFLPGTKQKFAKTGSGSHHGFDFSPEAVAGTAKAAFLEWAGTADLERARDKFRHCAALLPAE